MRQDMVQVVKWIDAIEFGGADQAVHGGCPFSAGVGAAMQPVFSPNCTRSEGALGNVIVDLDVSVIEVACQGVPSVGHVPNGFGGFRFFGQFVHCLMQPTVHRIEQRLGTTLPFPFAHIRRFAPQVGFDQIKLTDALDGFCCDWRGMHNM